MQYDDINQIIDLVDKARKRDSETLGYGIDAVDDEERKQCYRWVNGQELKAIIETDGYSIILNYIRSYLDEFITDTLRTNPVNKDEVLQNQAVAFAADKIYRRLLQDINLDIEASKTLPEVVKQSMTITKRATPAPKT